MNYYREAKNIIRRIAPNYYNADLEHDIAQTLAMIDLNFEFDEYSKVYQCKGGTSSKRGYSYNRCRYLILSHIKKNKRELKKLKRYKNHLNTDCYYESNFFNEINVYLNKKEKIIIEKYFIEGYTLTEIAKKENLSIERIRQIKDNALFKVKQCLEKN